MWALLGQWWCHRPAGRYHWRLQGRDAIYSRQALHRHAQLLHPQLWRVHGIARQRLTPTICLAILAAASSKSTCVIAGRDCEPAGYCVVVHRCGYILVPVGVVTQSTASIGACEDAVLCGSPVRRCSPVRQASQLHAQSRHLSLWRVHGRARPQLTPAVGLVGLAAAISKSTCVGIAGRDRDPARDCAAGHRCGLCPDNGGAVAQLAVAIGACGDAVP